MERRRWTKQNLIIYLMRLCLVFVHISFVYGQTKYRLKLVQILFRHGDRTPVNPFPKDKFKDSWKEGLGQLTKEGMQQQYELGQYIREKYDGFINETYNTDEITVRSSDTDRTLMSGLCNLAGLFPPKDDQKWNLNLSWQPIPVHTRPVDEDYALSSDSICPKYDELFDQVVNSAEVQEFFARNKELFEKLSKYTGIENMTLEALSNIYDTLFVEKCHNKSIPEWANETIFEELTTFQNLGMAWCFKTEELRKLRGGPLLGDMVFNMQEKVDLKINSKKIFMYSAHDMTLAALLSALNLYNNLQPPYASAIFVELFDDDNGNFFVQILYRNSTAINPIELQLRNCSLQCPFSKFKDLVSALIPVDIKKACATGVVSDNISLISAIIGSVLGCFLLMFIIAAYAFYRRNSDQYRYFNVQSDNI